MRVCERMRTDRQGEDELLRLCRMGDRAACGELVRIYRDRVVNLAYGMLRNRADAEDAAQEAFVRAFTRLSEFRGESAFFSWLYRIVINVCGESMRRRSRTEVQLDPEMHDDSGGESERADDRIHVNSVLSGLPEHLRTILVLREIDDLSYEEIAGILSIPVGTVRSRLSAAREAFRRAYEELMGDEL